MSHLVDLVLKSVECVVAWVLVGDFEPWKLAEPRKPEGEAATLRQELARWVVGPIMQKG